MVYATWKDKPAETVTVSFNNNGGSGSMADQPVEKGKTYVLPACGFTPPANKEFKAWDVNGTEYQPEASITVNADTSVKAIWKDKLQSINVVPADNGSITAPASAKVGDKVTITVKPDSGYELEKSKFKIKLENQ